MEKTCDIVECILYEDGEENHCMEYADIAECAKPENKRLKARIKELEEMLAKAKALIGGRVEEERHWMDEFEKALNPKGEDDGT